MILIDAGPLIAFHLESDPAHAVCVDQLRSIPGSFLTTWPVVVEVMYFLGARGGWFVQARFFQLVRKRFVHLAPSEEINIDRVAELMAKYADLPMDLADASLVALAEQRGLDTVFTLDTDFGVYRMKNRKALRIIPTPSRGRTKRRTPR